MKTILLTPETDENAVKTAAELIRAGEVVGMPTETVYGLAANALNGEAVKKIFLAKGRPQDNPLIVHIADFEQIYDLCPAVPPQAKLLADAFWPGPLTMIVPKGDCIPDEVSCGLDTVAIRVPKSEAAQEFLRYLNLPIAAPSANISKHVSPVTAIHVFNDFNGKIPLILDGGQCTGGIESTVLDVTTDTPIILRSGLVTADMITKVVGKCLYSANKPTDKIRAPGMKYRHYCPKCETALFERSDIAKAQALYDESLAEGKKPYFMCDEEMAKKINGNVLSLGKTAEEIAFHLYDKLHEAEEKADIVIAFVVDTGSDVDVGVMNRLSKACKKID